MLRRLPESVIGLGDQWFCPFGIKNQSCFVRAGLNADSRVSGQVVLCIGLLLRLVGMLPHCNFLRELCGSISLTDEPSFLFKDL